MLIHMNHARRVFRLLKHVDLKLSNCHQIPPTKVVKVHDPRILSVSLIQHRTYQILVANSHIDKVLTMLCPNTTTQV